MPYRVQTPRRRRAFYFLLVAGAAAGIVALGLTVAVSVSHSNDLATRALVGQLETKQQAAQAKRLAEALGGERRDTILRLCRGQNERHVASIRELHALVVRAERKPRARRRQLRASEQSFVLLIDAFFPLQNCKRLVHIESTPRRSNGQH